MTVKEIAELCGVNQSTVWRWAKDPACKMQAEKLGISGHGKSADFTLEETLAVIGEGGKNKALASLLAENAANKNALAIPNDISARLDRIERAICQFAQCLQQLSSQANNGENNVRLENKQDKEKQFYGFVAGNIHLTRHFAPIKRVEIWERYTEKVKKADRMMQKEFFNKLTAVFPQMHIKRTRIDPHFQFFCYGIDLVS